MTPIQKLRAEYRIPKDMVFIIPKEQIEAVEVLGLTEIDPGTNHDRFWGDGETWGYNGTYSAFTIRHSFHGGSDQRRRVERIFIDSKNYSVGVDECMEALNKY